MIRFNLWCVAVAISFTGAVQNLCAQPMADRFPATTLVYAGWSPGAALQNTLPAKMLADERFIQPWRLIIQEMLMSVPEGLAGGEDRISQDLPQLFSDAVQCEGAFALLDLKKNGRDWSPQAVLVINLGAKRKSFEEHFKPIHDRLKARLGDRVHMMKLENSWLWMKTIKEVPEYTWGFLGDSFVFYYGNRADEFLPTLSAAKPAESLKTSPNFIDTFGKIPGDAYLTTYIDLRLGFDLARKMLRDANNSDLAAAGLMWDKTALALGIDNARALGQKTWVDDGQFVARTLLRTEGAPHGLLAQLVQPGVDDAMLKVIPADAMGVFAARLDLSKFYDAIKAAAVAIVGEDANKSFGAFEDEAAGRGLPVAKMLEPLGDQWVFYDASSTGGFPFLGLTAVVSVRDADKLHQALAGVEKALSQVLSGGAMKLSSYEADGVKIRYLHASSGSSFFSPAYAVTADKLIIAFYPQIVEDAIKQVNGEGKSLLDRPEFIARQKQTGGGGPLVYLSEPEVVKAVYPLMLPLLSLLRELGGGVLGDEGAPVAQENLLPSMRRLLMYTGEEMVSIRLTPDGIAATRSVANPLLSPLSIADTVPLWVALALPTISNAGLESDRAKSANNLRQIGNAISLYAGDNKQKAPPDLDTLVKSRGLGNEILKSPLGTAKDGRDYRYFPFDMTNTTAQTDEIVIAYDAAELEQGEGTNILFADGHVDWVDAEDVKIALKKSDEARKAPKK